MLDTHGYFAYLYIINLKERYMKTTLTALALGIGLVLVAFGNDLGLLGLIPAGILVLTERKKV